MITVKKTKLDLGNLFSSTWRIFQNNGWRYIGGTILIGVLWTLAQIIPVVNLFSSFVVLVPLLAGFFTFTRQIQRGKKEFAAFFEPLNRIGKYTVFNLLWALLYIATVVLFVFSFVFLYILLLEGNPLYETEDFIVILLSLLGFITLNLILFFYGLAGLGGMLIGVYKLSHSDAFKVLFKLYKQYFASIILLNFIYAVLMIIGAALFMIGLLVVVPCFFISLYLLAQKTITVEETLDNLIDDFGVSKSDQNTEV